MPGKEIAPMSKTELEAAVTKLRLKNRAPGPDGIPGRILAHVVPILEKETLSLLTECLASGRVSRRWKTGKLVLLRKHGRPADSPSAYRPIVLFDEACKLFE